MNGTAHIPPIPINIKDYEFDGVHVNEKEHKRNIVKEEADKFVEDAIVSVSRWNGRFENYYGDAGAAYVDRQLKMIRTAFRNDEYDKKIKKLLEIIKNES